MVKIQNLNIPFRGFLFFSAAFALITILLVITFQKRLPPEVPLFYGAAEGEAQLAPSWGLVVPSLVSIIVIIVNSTLASFSKGEFAKTILVLSALVVTFFSMVTTFKIIFLVW